MKKRFCIILMVLFAMLGTKAFAANNVEEIKIDVVIRDDASAYITQEWRGNFREGTECYIPIKTDKIGIESFIVSDMGGSYEFVPEWNVNWSFEEKSRRCGINYTGDGVELCFGISEYGENRYAIEYIVKDFIKGYTESDGVNFMFINPNMSTFPTDAVIDICLQSGEALSEENAKIWAFGYNGEIEFSDGHILAYTTKALEGSNSMIVMLELDDNVVNPRVTVEESFESVKERAFSGSDYSDDKLTEIIFAIILLIIAIVFIAATVWSIKRKREIKKFCKEAPYFRDVPNGGDIEISHFLAKNFDISKDESLIIGTVLLKMINSGCIEAEEEKSVGFFGREKVKLSLVLKKEPEGRLEKALYDIVIKAAGDDGVLQEKELVKYSASNPEMIERFIKDAGENGEVKLINAGGFKNEGNRISNLSESGKEELRSLIGLKKYLEDFSLIHERGVAESEIWQEYLVYAYLLGIGEKAIEQFKAMYPEKISEIESYSGKMVIANTYSGSMYKSHRDALNQKRMSGGGGRASLGGGGGFSGGGSGGGTR